MAESLALGRGKKHLQDKAYPFVTKHLEATRQRCRVLHTLT